MPNPSPMKARPAGNAPRRLLRALSPWLVLGLAGCSNLSLPFFGSAKPAPAPVGGRPLNWGETVEAASRPTDTAYRIGPEDALEISVWRDETLKSTVLVRPDGGISFPLAGDFVVAGMTANEVRNEITRRLDKFVPDPVVTVTVARVGSIRIYVLGRVNKPGDMLVGRNVDVLQALAMAGGMTPFASEDGIRIIRRVDGRNVSIPFRYSLVRKGEDLTQNIPLLGGDILLVP